MSSSTIAFPSLFGLSLSAVAETFQIETLGRIGPWLRNHISIPPALRSTSFTAQALSSPGGPSVLSPDDIVGDFTLIENSTGIEAEAEATTVQQKNKGYLFFLRYIWGEYVPPTLKEASCPKEITARLNFEHPRCYGKEASELLEENAKPYLKDDKSVDKDRIFKQVDMDLARTGNGMSQFTLNGIVYDGTPEKNAKALFQELLKTGRNEREILELMTLLQQGVFASIQMNIMGDLDIFGFDSGMSISGAGDYLAMKYIKEKGLPTRQYNIRTDGKNILLKCSIYYEVLAKGSEIKAIVREKPYGIIEASIQLDLDAGKASESWQVKEVIE